MGVEKVTISIEAKLLKKIDSLVKERVFLSRSQAIQTAVEEKVALVGRTRLAGECTKLDKNEEQTWADLGLSAEVNERPEY